MKKTVCGFIYFFFVSLSLLMAQTKPFKPKFNVQLDNKNSFIGTKSVRFIGVLSSVQIGAHSRLGLGYYYLARDSKFKTIQVENGVDSTLSINSFRYFSMEYHYILFDNEHWNIYFPLEFGVGGVNTQYSSLRNPVGFSRSMPAQVVNGGVIVYYKLFSFIGLGVGGGYRAVRLGSRPNTIADDLTKPTYTIRVKLYLGPLAKIVFHNYYMRKEYEKQKEKNS